MAQLNPEIDWQFIDKENNNTLTFSKDEYCLLISCPQFKLYFGRETARCQVLSRLKAFTSFTKKNSEDYTHRYLIILVDKWSILPVLLFILVMLVATE
jgi:hypothetical protein